MNYTEKVLEHFNNPRNVGYLSDYHGIGKLGDPGCGDFIEVTIHMSENNSILEDIRYRIKGCPAAIATSSITSELMEGETVEKALELKDIDIVNALDGLPENKVHCSLLAVKALHMAIQDAIMKRLFKKAGLVKSDKDFEEKKAAGEFSQYFPETNPEIDHECDGSCETMGKECN